MPRVNYYKIICVRLAVYKLLTALLAPGTGRVEDSETYVFNIHINVDCFRMIA